MRSGRPWSRSSRAGQEAGPPAGMDETAAHRRDPVAGRAGAPWRDVPPAYGPWQTVYGLFRRWQRDGTRARILTGLQARADAAGLITWDVSVDSTWRGRTSTRPGRGSEGTCRPSRPAESRPSPLITGWAGPAAG